MWYCLQAQTNFENIVKATIENRLATSASHLADQISQVLVPEVDSLTPAKKGLVKKKDKIYPGYIFVEVDELTPDLFLFLKHTPKVLGFVGGTKTVPATIPEKEIQVILDRINVSAVEPEYKLTYKIGQFVTLLSGPFKDFSGTVEAVNHERQKLSVSITVFNRSTEVDVDFKDVEKSE